MDIQLYDRLANIKLGIWLLSVGVVILVVVLWQQSQRLEVLDLKIQAMAKQLAVAVNRKDG